MDNKLIVFAVVAIMVMVGCVVSIDNESDATDSVNNNEIADLVKVYFKESADSDADPNMTGKQAASQTVYGYDLYQALSKVQKTDNATNLNFKITPINDSWNQQIGTGEWAYYNPDENYGQLTSLSFGTTTTNVLNSYDVWVYTKEATTPEGFGSVNYGWHQAINAIGWYHPFDDYSAYAQINTGTDEVPVYKYHSLAAASIAIMPVGITPTDVICQSPNVPYDVPSLNGIANNTPTADVDQRFVYKFNIKSSSYLTTFTNVSAVIETNNTYSHTDVTPLSIFNNTVTIVGAGSNAYEALKDALGNDSVVGMDEYAKYMGEAPNGYMQYYSWMDTILGTGTKTIKNTDSNTTTYYYWSSFVGQSYCDYTLGYYSQFNGAQNPGSMFTMEYIKQTSPNSS